MAHDGTAAPTRQEPTRTEQAKRPVASPTLTRSVPGIGGQTLTGFEAAGLQRISRSKPPAGDLRALNAQADRNGRYFADLHGLSATEFHALLHVTVGETSGTPLTAGQLRQRMGLTNAGVTYLVRPER